MAAAQTPYSALHDIDATRPSGSIKIRVKTYAHTLMLATEELEDMSAKREQLERSIAKKKHALLVRLAQQRGQSSELGRELASLEKRLKLFEEREAAKQAIVEAAQAEQRSPMAKKPSALRVVK